MAKGRPILATLVMVLGIFALAVPGSSNFAGEFAILAGVFEHGLGLRGRRRGRDRARGALRAAADLRDPPRAARRRRCARSPTTSSAPSSCSSCRSSRSSPCSRPGRPAISERSFPADAPASFIGAQSAEGPGRAVIPTPEVDWLALSPTLALLGLSAVTLLGAVIVPRAWERRLLGRRLAGRVRDLGRLRGNRLRALAGRRQPDRRVDDARPARGVRGPRDRARRARRRARLGRRRAVVTTSASTTRSSPRRPPGWSSSSRPGT